MNEKFLLMNVQNLEKGIMFYNFDIKKPYFVKLIICYIHHVRIKTINAYKH